MTAPTEITQQKRKSIELLVGWLDVVRRRDRQAAAATLDPGVVWQGLRPDLVCRGPDEVLDVLLGRGEQELEVDALELIAAPGGVIFAAHRPDAGEVAGIELRGALCLLARCAACRRMRP